MPEQTPKELAERLVELSEKATQRRWCEQRAALGKTKRVA
jgi:hypothetical protein